MVRATAIPIAAVEAPVVDDSALECAPTVWLADADSEPEIVSGVEPWTSR